MNPGQDAGWDEAWEVCPQVQLRPEDFGALAYHGAQRRLVFVRSAHLVATVGALPQARSVLEACTIAGVPEQARQPVLRGVRLLADKGILQRRTHSNTTPGHASDSHRSTTAAVAANASTQTAAAVRVVPPVGAAVVAATAPTRQPSSRSSVADNCETGARAPICITWELTYGCNLSCRHCLSSSGRRDPRELTTAQAESVIDELARMQVFYANIGGGEPTLRSDFWHLLGYAVDRRVGVKFSTNGHRLDRDRARYLAVQPYLDVQVSLDGATAEVNDDIRGAGSYATATAALEALADEGFVNPKISVVVTRHNVAQLDRFAELADRYQATLRLTRLRPSGRGMHVWQDLRPTREQQRDLHAWLLERGESVLTGDSFFHLAGFGASLPGMNVCGAGRVVCLIDPVGDVYACPFALHESFRAGNVRDQGGLATVWQQSELFRQWRKPSVGGACRTCPQLSGCRGGCPAAKFFTGLPLAGPDPECPTGLAEPVLSGPRQLPVLSIDHSHPSGPHRRPPLRPCHTDPMSDPGGP